MSYQVVAPLVLAKDPEGKVHERYQDAIIQWLPEDQAAHLLAIGFIVDLGDSADDNGSADNGDADDDVEVRVGEDGKPLRASAKPVLVKWLSENQSDYSAEELNAMHKDDLWALIDAK